MRTELKVRTENNSKANYFHSWKHYRKSGDNVVNCTRQFKFTSVFHNILNEQVIRSQFRIELKNVVLFHGWLYVAKFRGLFLFNKSFLFNEYTTFIQRKNCFYSTNKILMQRTSNFDSTNKTFLLIQ